MYNQTREPLHNKLSSCPQFPRYEPNENFQATPQTLHNTRGLVQPQLVTQLRLQTPTLRSDCPSARGSD